MIIFNLNNNEFKFENLTSKEIESFIKAARKLSAKQKQIEKFIKEASKIAEHPTGSTHRRGRPHKEPKQIQEIPNVIEKDDTINTRNNVCRRGNRGKQRYNYTEHLFYFDKSRAIREVSKDNNLMVVATRSKNDPNNKILYFIVNRNEAKLDVTSSCRKQFNDWYKDYYKTYDQSIARYVTSKIIYKHKKLFKKIQSMINNKKY